MADQTYSFEYWEWDFLAKHLLANEHVGFYDEKEDYAEIIATTERQDSTVVFHGKRDSQNSWLKVFSLDEGEVLGDSYLSTMTEPRVRFVRERARNTYNV